MSRSTAGSGSNNNGFYVAGDVMQAIIADIGSYSTKMGFAGEDFPKAYFRSNVAVKRRAVASSERDGSEDKSDDGMDIDDTATSSPGKQSPSKQQQQRSSSNNNSGSSSSRQPIAKVHHDYLTHPLEGPTNNNDAGWSVSNAIDETNGLLLLEDDSYELIQLFYQKGFKQHLCTNPSEHPFLMVERSYTPPPIRQECLEILMEQVGVPAAFLGRDAALACYSCGRTTGTVVDMGHSGTVVAPVYEGYVEQSTIRISPMGAKHMDQYLLTQLDQRSSSNNTTTTTSSSKNRAIVPLYQVRHKNLVRRDTFHELARLDLARQCREQGVGAAVASVQDSNFTAPSLPFELPDGTTVDVPAKVRFATADLLLGTEEASITKREELCQKRQEDLTSFWNKVVAEQEAAKKVGDEEDDDHEETEYYRNVFSEAAAVGISQRRRNNKDESSSSEQQNKQRRPPFSLRHLKRACVSHFRPPRLTLSKSPVSAMICDAAFQSDRDQQATLLGNVVLAGGGACIGPTDNALPDLLREQVESIINQHTPGWRVKVLSPGFTERSVCSWLGGSILGSLGTFHEMWISKAEYEEWGSAIVNKKCP